MRIVFMGTPDFAAGILEDLARDHEILSAYTMPDKVRSRGRRTSPSPVKEAAERLGIPVRTPDTLKAPEELSRLEAMAPDAICVAAYGKILPKEVLTVPRYACLNVHASLLPKWRGAAPVERAILSGDDVAGISIMRMEEGLDTGDYCLQAKTDASGKNAAELTAELSDIGSKALSEALNLLESGEITWTAQTEDQATYADKIDNTELFLDPTCTFEANVRRVLASGSTHPAKLRLDGVDIAALEAIAVSKQYAPEADADPGGVLAMKKRLLLKASDGWMELLRIKPAGRKAMDAASYLAGARLSTDASWSALNE